MRAIARAMASICNDERASSGVMSGHDGKTLSLSARVVDADLALGAGEAIVSMAVTGGGAGAAQA